MALADINGTLDQHEAAIDEIVASCNGDMRGAVKALLLVNEQLESELRQVYAADGARVANLARSQEAIALTRKN
jgi:hypothetical protein